MPDRRRRFTPSHPEHLGEARRTGEAYTPVLTHADLDSAVQNVKQESVRDGVFVPKDGIELPDPDSPTAPPTPIYGSKPCVPSNLTVDTGADGDLVYVDITWSPGDCTNSGKTFEVELRRTDDPLEAQFPITRTTTHTSIRFEGLEGSTDYECRVRAISPAGIPSDWSEVIAFLSSADETIPSDVTGVVMSAGLRTVVIRWEDVPDFDVINGNGTYEIDLATNASFSPILRTVRQSGTVTSFGDLSPATTYYARAWAIDKSGNRSENPSSTVTAVTGQAGSVDIAANAIAAEHIQAGAVHADELFAGAVTTDKLAANAVTAEKLSSITMEVGKFIQSTSYSPGSAGWRINASGNAEFNNATFRGTIHATSGTLGSLSVTGTITGGTFSGPRIQWGSAFIDIVGSEIFLGNADVKVQNSLSAQGSGTFGGRVWGKKSGQTFASNMGLYVSTGFVGATKVGVGLENDGNASGCIFKDGASGQPDRFQFTNGAQTAYSNIIGGVYTNGSSERFKADITEYEDSSLAKVKALRPKRFRYKEDKDFQIGFTAEEVAEVIPDAVSFDGEGRPEGIAYSTVTAVLVKAVQELTERVEALEAQLSGS